MGCSKVEGGAKVPRELRWGDKCWLGFGLGLGVGLGLLVRVRAWVQLESIQTFLFSMTEGGPSSSNPPTTHQDPNPNPNPYPNTRLILPYSNDPKPYPDPTLTLP